MAFDDRLTALKRGIIHLGRMAVHHKRQPPRTWKSKRRQKKGLSSWWEREHNHSLNDVDPVSCLFSNSEAKLKKSPGEGEDCSGRSVIGSSSIFQFLRRGEAGGGEKHQVQEMNVIQRGESIPVTN